MNPLCFDKVAVVSWIFISNFLDCPEEYCTEIALLLVTWVPYPLVKSREIFLYPLTTALNVYQYGTLWQKTRMYWQPSDKYDLFTRGCFYSLWALPEGWQYPLKNYNKSARGVNNLRYIWKRVALLTYSTTTQPINNIFEEYKIQFQKLWAVHLLIMVYLFIPPTAHLNLMIKIDHKKLHAALHT
jgi:hypothetical protein